MKTHYYYVVMRPGQDGDDTILLNTPQGPQIAPFFTQKEKAQRFIDMWGAQEEKCKRV
jgi:hypothetical protein